MADEPDEKSSLDLENDGHGELDRQEELIEQVDVEECLSEAAATDEREESNVEIESRSEPVHRNPRRSRVSSSKSNVALYAFISIDVKSNASAEDPWQD